MLLFYTEILRALRMNSFAIKKVRDMEVFQFLTVFTTLFTHCSSAFSSISPWSSISFTTLSISWESSSAWLSGSLMEGEKYLNDFFQTIHSKKRVWGWWDKKEEYVLIKISTWQYNITWGLPCQKCLASPLLIK